MPSKSITDAFVRTVKLPAKDGGRRQSKSSSEDADHACERALDPALSSTDVASARRDMEDATFRRDRLQKAAQRLSQRLREMRAKEENSRRQIAYDRAMVAGQAPGGTGAGLPADCRSAC